MSEGALNLPGLSVGETRGLDSNGQAPAIFDHDELYRQFITDVLFEGNQRMGTRVNSFEFLYSILRQLFSMQTTTAVRIDVGEGLVLLGDVREASVQLRLTFGTSTIRQWSLTVPQFVLVLSNMLCALVASMEDGGVDVDKYVKAFPPVLF